MVGQAYDPHERREMKQLSMAIGFTRFETGRSFEWASLGLGRPRGGGNDSGSDLDLAAAADLPARIAIARVRLRYRPRDSWRLR
jgi:hypothetical protein